MAVGSILPINNLFYPLAQRKGGIDCSLFNLPYIALCMADDNKHKM